MRVFVAVLILVFSLQSFAKADDIRDFEIEGMSIGESLLDYYSEKEIEKSFIYKSDKYYLFSSTKYKSINYDAIQFHIKKNDKKYIIAAIEGFKLFDGNFKDCFKLKDSIVKDLSKMFTNSEILDDKGNHDYDPTGDSKYYRTNIGVNPQAKYFNLSVTCYDWSEKIEAKFADKLSVAIANDEFNLFSNTEAY